MPTSTTVTEGSTTTRDSRRSSLAKVADFAIILNRFRRQSDSPQDVSTASAAATSAPSASIKSHHIQSSSGDQPVTHTALLEKGIDLSEDKTIQISRKDMYVCEGAVDAKKLLRATRDGLLESARTINANVLVNELWHCTICGPKNRKDGSFRVKITYTAAASRSEQASDPQVPVNIKLARGVPGLMTIKSRTQA